MSASWSRIIAHADLDAFYASVEQLDNAALRGRAVLVGPRSRRGVVLAASYEARAKGARNGMPMLRALRGCPDAAIVAPRLDRYSQLSRQFMAVLDEFSPEVEPLSLDEAFIDMTGATHIFGQPAEMGAAIKAAVYDATGLRVSVGVATSKYAAKVASAYAKPDGLTVVAQEDVVAWLGEQSVSRLWGAGPKAQARMRVMGLETIGDVARADRTALTEALGSAGTHFFELANARDPRPVRGGLTSRSMGSDRTLERDVSSPVLIRRYLRQSADRIARRLRSRCYLAGGVRVRLKTTQFELLSRQCRLAQASDLSDELYESAVSLLPRFQHPGPYRLVGMAAFAIERAGGPVQLSLLDAHAGKRTLEVAIDDLSERFGDGVVRRARDLSANFVGGAGSTLDALEIHRSEPTGSASTGTGTRGTHSKPVPS